MAPVGAWFSEMPPNWSLGLVDSRNRYLRTRDIHTLYYIQPFYGISFVWQKNVENERLHMLRIGHTKKPMMGAYNREHSNERGCVRTTM